jgi:hypothetical protein
VLLAMLTPELVNGVSELRMIIAMLKHFMQAFFSWMSYYLMEPLNGCFQHLLGQGDMPLFIWTITLMYMTYNVFNIFV